MKNIAVILLSVSVSFGFAQATKKGKEAKMAPVLEKGYYVTMKGDTVKGEIQTNLDSEADLYKGVYFKDAKGGKVTLISSKKAKAYGYGDNHFMMMAYDAQTDVYLKYLAKGRLNLMEYKMSDGSESGTKSEYFIQDTKADDESKELRELNKLNPKFYKKELKPYMKDQPMIWNDLDKFNFNISTLANSIREYNRFYENPQ